MRGLDDVLPEGARAARAMRPLRIDGHAAQGEGPEEDGVLERSLDRAGVMAGRLDRDSEAGIPRASHQRGDLFGIAGLATAAGRWRDGQVPGLRAGS